MSEKRFIIQICCWKIRKWYFNDVIIDLYLLKWPILAAFTCCIKLYLKLSTLVTKIFISAFSIDVEEVHCAPGCGCVRAGTLLHIQAQIRSPSSIVLLSRHWSSHPAPSGCRPEGQIKGKKCRTDQKRSNSTTRQHRKETKELLTCAGDVFGRLCRWPYKKKHMLELSHFRVFH